MVGIDLHKTKHYDFIHAENLTFQNHQESLLTKDVQSLNFINNLNQHKNVSWMYRVLHCQPKITYHAQAKVVCLIHIFQVMKKFGKRYYLVFTISFGISSFQ